MKTLVSSYYYIFTLVLVTIIVSYNSNRLDHGWIYMMENISIWDYMCIFGSSIAMYGVAGIAYQK